MLSTAAMHQYSPATFAPLPSSNMGASPTMEHTLNLKASKSRHHPYDAQRNGMNAANGVGQVSSNTQSATPGPIRRRISRACDQCNQLRTKCDGKLPCQHCIDFTLKCEYARERKKRGKASRKDIQAAAAAAAAAAQGGSVSASSTTSTSPTGTIRVLNGASRSDLPPPPVPGSVRKSSTASNSTRASIGDLHDMSNGQMHHHHMTHHHHLPTPDSPSHLQIHHGQNISHDGMPIGYDRMSSFHNQLQSPNGVVGGPRMLPQPLHTSNGGPGGYGGEYSMISPHHPTHPMGSLPTSAPSPLSNLLGHSPDAGSPSWLSMPSPPQPMMSSNVGVRYPVLLPLLPHINSIIPAMLACDLLDLYFTNPSTAFFQPASPYVLTHIFRKRSFLHPTSPRPTSPALLCAMLWVAAQTCDAPFLTASPSARGRVCQRLLELCIGLLRPLVHVNIGSTQHSYSADNETGGMGVGLGGLGGGGSGREGVGAAGTLDDVLTYIHLGIVISASEFKTASLRWWNTAWALARELRLNRELPPTEMELAAHDQEEDNHHSPADSVPGSNHHPSGVSEEEKEERRRTWWLLYIMDRHLALCYNRPLALLDIECENLYLPIDEVSWQNGDFYPEPHTAHMYQHGSPSALGLGTTGNRQRTTGPLFEITGSGLFDYFLPLMTILGEVVDLHHARNRPRFSNGGLNALGTTAPGNEFEERINEIAGHLDAYERSLQEYEAANCTSDSNMNRATSPTVTAQPVNGGQSHGGMTETEMQNRVVLSYGTHVMHVLHILLVGKWDPVSMLDDNDLWISSPGFLSATAHAVSAAEAISNILKYDPDLSFMPYFFGIYLLQGSFLLLLIADKLQGEASEAVITACETIVRAHEVCVVTLNTEYQRNFRKVMRSALSQVRGRGLPEDMEEQKLRRREVLQLYRWCGDGTGLAL